jgi:hypothetical protein
VVHAAHINGSFGSRHQLSMVFAILTRSQHLGIWGFQVSRLLLCRALLLIITGKWRCSHRPPSCHSMVEGGKCGAHQNGSLRFAAPVVNGVCLIYTRNGQQGKAHLSFSSVSSLAKALAKKHLLCLLQHVSFLNLPMHLFSPYLSIQTSHRACQA